MTRGLAWPTEAERVAARRASTLAYRERRRAARVPIVRENYRLLSAVERDEAVAAYLAGSSLNEVAALFGCSIRPVTAELEARGIDRRPVGAPVSVHRADVFERFTPDDLYWLGLLWADGSLMGDRLDLSLRYDDGEHVAAFGRFLGLERPPRRYANQVRTGVTSAVLAGRLRALGMTKNPRTPALTLLSSADFWRGMVDGDGSVLVTGRGQVLLRLNGYPVVTGPFLDFVRAAGVTTRAVPRRHASITRAQLSGPNAVHMIRLLYANAPVALARKAETARKVLAK